MGSRCHPFGAGGTLLLLLLAAAPPPLAAQSGEGRPLSLREALERAPASSEQLDIARAGVTRARGDQLRARSAGFPQINGSAGYSRALQSQFQGLGGAPDTTAGPPPPACGPFTPNPGLPLGERVDSLERAAECAARGGTPFGGLDFGNLGFGAENTFNFGASLAQPLFTGGRVTAQNRIARAGREVAEIGVESARAQVALDVTQAYWDAALSDRLVTIAQASLEQAEETLRLTELARRVGNLSEFELLRARVARDNQRPVLIQRVTERDLAYLRLKQLLELPLDEPLALSDALEGAAAGPTPDLADTLSAARAPVRQAAEGVRVQEGQLRIARAQRLPAINLVSQYGRVAYTTGAGIPAFNSFRANWTIGAALQIPIFTGGRIRGDELAAEAGVVEARARLEQVRKLAALDTRSAQAQLASARAAWEASAGTGEEAQRAYAIAEIRYREGISTQLELADARLLLQQAQANRALAARNLQVARTRVALLPDLPLGAGAAAAQGDAGQGAPQQQRPQQQQQSPVPQATGAGVNPGQGGFPGAGIP